MERHELNAPIVCADGFKMSVQANETAYCTPRVTGAARYTAVEVGYPSQYESLLMGWCDGGEPTSTVYGYVPAHVILTVCAKHGGVVSGELPPGVVELRSDE